MKAQSQEKRQVQKEVKIEKQIFKWKYKEIRVKKDIEEIETINIELDHRVSKLIAENEHLKQAYMQLYDLIKSTQMLKLDVEPIVSKLLNNRTAHSDYLRHTQEQALILREIVEQRKSQNPLNNSLDSALAVTPKNKDKIVRFTEPVTSSGNTNIKTASSSNLVSNKPMLSSTGVKPSTSASRSQSSGNTKKDKIQRTPISTRRKK
ncbi:hypothetical protein Tco_0755473 [Tanacetum coccineum]